jgi:hypothetical protein
MGALALATLPCGSCACEWLPRDDNGSHFIVGHGTRGRRVSRSATPCTRDASPANRLAWELSLSVGRLAPRR